MINHLTIVGTIAFEPSCNDKQTAATIHVNVRRNFKPEGEQYYPTDKVVCKAFSEQRTKMIMERFSKNDIVVVEGRLQKSDDYTNNKGEDVRGDWELIIDHIDGPFCYRNVKSDHATNTQVPKPVRSLPQPNKQLAQSPAPPSARTAPPSVRTAPSARTAPPPPNPRR